MNSKLSFTVIMRTSISFLLNWQRRSVKLAPCRWLPPGKPYGKGRITMCGDGCQPMTPNLGQGGCVALEVPFSCDLLFDALRQLVPVAESRWKRSLIINPIPYM